MIKSFLLAAQFLTVIPIKIRGIDEKKIARSLVYFPLVGAILGLILVAINTLLQAIYLPRLSVDIVILVALIFLTGGMHLDGLSDTFDAFLSGKNKEEMLKIMRDSHCGVMGVLGLITVILLKLAFLYSIIGFLKPQALILMCALSRWGMVFSIFLFPYARQDGKAKAYIEGINVKVFIISTIASLLLAFIVWQAMGVFIMLIIAICVFLMGKFIKRKIQGITGDTLGATCEITEIIILICVSIIQRGVLWKI